MTLLQENIVYFWLIPVVFQICLPLTIMGGSFARTLMGFLLRKPMPATALQN
jgi:hypothetical protein